MMILFLLKNILPCDNQFHCTLPLQKIKKDPHHNIGSYDQGIILKYNINFHSMLDFSFRQSQILIFFFMNHDKFHHLGLKLIYINLY